MGVDVANLGPESLLGDASLLDGAQDGRDRLALATRYLANWYRATEDSPDEDVWRHRIDAERFKVEAAYRQASDPLDALFWRESTARLYDEAAASWPQLWRDLKLSADTLKEPSLLDRAASIAEAPLSWVPTFTEGLAKSVGDTLSGIARQLAVPALVVGAGALVYYFRRPLLALVGKGAA